MFVFMFCVLVGILLVIGILKIAQNIYKSRRRRKYGPIEEWVNYQNPETYDPLAVRAVARDPGGGIENGGGGGI